MALPQTVSEHRQGTVLGADEISALLAITNPQAVRLYLWLCVNPSPAEEAACRELALTPAALASAVADCTAAGLLKSAEEAAHRPAAAGYTREEIADLRLRDEGFAEIVKTAERVLKPMLTVPDLRDLAVIYDTYGLPADCAVALLVYTAERARRGGFTPSFSVLRREALRWRDKGINTSALADAHIRRETEIEEQVQQIVKLTGRDACPADDKSSFRRWCEAGFSPEAVAIAFDLSRKNIGELKIGYVSRIIQAWQREGLTDAGAIRARQKKQPAKRRTSQTAETGAMPEGAKQTLDDFRDYIKNNGGDGI